MACIFLTVWDFGDVMTFKWLFLLLLLVVCDDKEDVKD